MSVEIEQWLAEQAISNVSDKNMDFCFAKSHELKVAAFLPLNYVLPNFNWKLCLLFVSSKYFELFFFQQVFPAVLFPASISTSFVSGSISSSFDSGYVYSCFVSGSFSSCRGGGATYSFVSPAPSHGWGLIALTMQSSTPRAPGVGLQNLKKQKPEKNEK